jgi:hypothetical protein
MELPPSPAHPSPTAPAECTWSLAADGTSSGADLVGTVRMSEGTVQELGHVACVDGRSYWYWIPAGVR